MGRREKPRPVNRKGLRMLDCPFYQECLSHAVSQDWQVWNCEECPYVSLSEIREKMRYIAPYYRILAEIYPEFKRRYEPVIDSLNVEV
ncbi:MAG: hypothetical protein JRJ12_06725 [Deltaproteobacteria bacterium]|nr:hypothetical protein [Deltaproteobacteria bacterium]MBW2071090.1 hypothetical protein [Deltaproteobacteria bacterium]